MIRWLAALALLAAPAAAQNVEDCDWRASARNLVEPWDETSRTFSNGKVRLALLDTIEPAAGALHLLVISPPYAELGDAQCKVISWAGSVGFSGLLFDQLEAHYDPTTGLQFAMPAIIYMPEDGFVNSTVLNFTLNQATGDINAWVNLGGE
ncbi:hypothetical protein [Aliiroseovarius subalbicans]|uniref:hypothetical protein n=1 Tax=Aliiroseovarius subalbicans TaxID=2925840 RepID=UPI001F599100|nr:hypothetical protein [Aliiroseovarius subalbicans]MCI2399726.1 hypothetical protein [Aliiroseovarius subalbicans]